MTDIFAVAASRLAPGKSCLDIGAGIKPQRMMRFAEHICIEPHGEYADWLEQHGYRVLRGPAQDRLAEAPAVETVFLLEVIEHMPESDGRAILETAKTKATRDIVLSSPLGFYDHPHERPDGTDNWGLNGAKWQKHVSGWTPDMLGDGWDAIVDPRYGGYGAFVAIWRRA